MAATAKASPTSRRAGHPSQRRPWSTDEENALMAGLDRVKGPHWSQILALFGPGGTINETLKDRNQVQLKDKARNLKLFFLKSNIEVPYYLSFVTGELKTRAPGQAAKNEAKEKERLGDGHIQAEGVLTPNWVSADDCERAVNGIDRNEAGGIEIGADDGTNEQENEFDVRGETELEDKLDPVVKANGKSSSEGDYNEHQQRPLVENNVQINGDQAAKNTELGQFLVETSRLRLNQVAKTAEMIT